MIETYSALADAVGRHFSTTAIEMRSRTRQAHVALARAVTWYLVRKHWRWTYVRTAREACMRDHVSIIRGIRRAAQMVADGDYAVLLAIRAVEKQLPNVLLVVAQ